MKSERQVLRKRIKFEVLLISQSSESVRLSAASRQLYTKRNLLPKMG